MQHVNIAISTICSELLKLSGSEILQENTAESCKQAASLLKKIREVVITSVVNGEPNEMTNEQTKALANDLHWIMVNQGE